MRDNLKKSIDESIFLKKKLYEKKYKKIINEIIEILYLKIINNNKIFICGNGGSAADAQHLSTEFLVRLNPKKNRKPYPMFTLTSDSTNMSAIGNDFGFENIFKRNLEASANKGDILIALSTSGKSKNIINVLKFANKIGVYSISLLGMRGGDCKYLSDLNLIVPSKNVARIQETHMFLGHFILNEVEKKLIRSNY
jgi:D-sedoheptulose 7-phosphate isomerase